MPRKETGPLNNYNIALKRMHSAEKLFHKKACFKVIDEEVQKLLDQGFVVKVAPEQVDHSQPEWYLPLQVVFMPERTTKGHDGLSLNNYLEKGPNYINSLPNVLATWRWDNVAYTGDDHKMFNEILVHSYEEVTQVIHLPFINGSDWTLAINQHLKLQLTPSILKQRCPKPSSRKLQRNFKIMCMSMIIIGGARATSAKDKQITNDIDAILGKGHLQIKAWHSNHPEIDQSNGEWFTDLLGLRWDKQTDKFSLHNSALAGQLEDFSEMLFKLSLSNKGPHWSCVASHN